MVLGPGTGAQARLRVVTALAAAVLLVAGLVAVVVRQSSGSPTPAQADRPAAPDTTTATGPTTSAPAVPADPDEPAFIREMRAQVAELRGLQWKAPLSLSIVSPSELVRRIREVNRRDADPVQLAGEGATYHLLGVIPPDVDYVQALDDLYATAVRGFYDPVTKELVVGDAGGDALEPSTKVTIAHELDHALTDQHFDFGSRYDALDKAGREEEVAGFQALIEGDARLLDNRWAARHLSEDEQVEAFFGGSVDSSEVVRIPPFLLETLGFPYEDGKDFVAEQVRRGGWAEVDRAYARPPTSTEQILHPELYPAHNWAPPALPDLAAATGCGAVHRGTLGEFRMGEVLESEIGETDGNRATEGWNGDAFQVVRCGSSVGMVDRWRSDTQGAADRLADGAAEWATGWSDADTPVTDGRFSGPGGSGRIVRRGTQVDLVLASDQPTADRLAAALG